MGLLIMIKLHCMNRLHTWLLFSILLIGFILRIYQLEQTPNGFASDEAAIGYNAYSILKTGRDEFGKSFPLSFKSFGEFKAPLYIYLTIPFIAIFGLNEFATRLPAAIFGISTIFFLYLLINKLFRNQKLALASALILTIIPWHLQFTRIAYEGSLVVFLLTLSTYFFLRGIDSNRFYFISFAGFALIPYAHYSVRLFLPLFIISLLIIYRRTIRSKILSIFFAILLGIIIIYPLIPQMVSSDGLNRASYISVFTDPGESFAINEKIAEHAWSNFKISIPTRILHNKIMQFTQKFIQNYIAHFDFSFLFIKGDEDHLFQTPNIGLIPLILFLPLLWGISKLITYQNPQKLLVLSWLFLAPIPSSLTRLSASSNRDFIIIIPICIIIGVGLFDIFKQIKGHYKLIAYITCVLFIFEYGLYLDAYYIHASIKNSRDIRVIGKDLVNMVKPYMDQYPNIWVTSNSGGYIHFLFYLKYPPNIYQNEAKLTKINVYGFGTIEHFGKFGFAKVPKYFDFSKNILYLAQAAEIPKNVAPMSYVYYPDGQLAYALFDTQILTKQDPESNILYKPENQDIYGTIIPLDEKTN
ncbi:MAG: hypothetical protein UR52_C0001G0100 [Candidatus Gottesmanbacteria bacterium GW2011_GWA1_34_13]|uniref:Glycosyltransferase RgtA/B/C/D-like domain-containing protein n=1 Tax=Candidatus Gottesmanbacteria bacterium GW2011_GWA1_34_13 TaxID=1618434 RepID=A0A0G0D9L0_9BACT|nr:MAG: hypothetical protein UR52_C0001G0100 [Candidatus Gottesmanbacteria bacterium GW2011_GWA1_34_13]